MTKIEELKTAFEAVTLYALLEDDPEYLSSIDLEAKAKFIAHAHDMTPTLVKVVEAMEALAGHLQARLIVSPDKHAEEAMELYRQVNKELK